jgi:hypothetical protein
VETASHAEQEDICSLVTNAVIDSYGFITTEAISAEMACGLCMQLAQRLFTLQDQ